MAATLQCRHYFGTEHVRQVIDVTIFDCNWILGGKGLGKNAMGGGGGQDS